MQAADPIDAVERILRAFNDRAWAAMAALVDDRVEYRDSPLGIVMRSPDDVVNWCKQGLVPFPDAQLDGFRLMGTGDLVASEFVERGTHLGPLEVPGRVIPPTNRSIEWRFCNVWRITRRGKLIGGESYYDLTSQLRQLEVSERA